MLSGSPWALAQTSRQPTSPAKPHFKTADPAWQTTWDAALATLAGNVRTVPAYNRPVLFEGSTYQGVWQECGPLESLVYAGLRAFVAEESGRLTPLEVARNTHMAFFRSVNVTGKSLPQAEPLFQRPNRRCSSLPPRLPTNVTDLEALRLGL